MYNTPGKLGKLETEEEEVTFLSAIVKLWKAIFDYKNEATGREFWYIAEFHAVLGFIAFYFFSKSFDMISAKGADFMRGKLLLYFGLVIVFYLIASFIPWTALTVRRMNAVGKKGLLLFPVLLLFVAGIIVLFGCVGSVNAALNAVGTNAADSVSTLFFFGVS